MRPGAGARRGYRPGMSRRVQALRPGEVYSRASLLAQHGLHPRELAGEGMVHVLPGLYARADCPVDLARLARAAQALRYSGTVVCDATAAELYGFPLPRRLLHEGGEPVHLRTWTGRSPRRSEQVVVHRRRDVGAVRHRGVVLSPPVVALRETAGRLEHADLVACIDALAADRHGCPLHIPLDRIGELAATMEGRGAARLRRAVDDARERVWSPMETRTRLVILAAGFPEPELNRRLRDPVTGDTFFLDLAYPHARIAIEYDGDGHRTDRARWRADLHKDEVLHRLGWTVLRISADDLHHPRRFLQRLRAALAGADPRTAGP